MARLAITMGDPAGVGPEICLRLLDHNFEGAELTIFGDKDILARCAETTGLPPAADSQIHHIPSLDVDNFVPAKLSASCGQASFTYIEEAIRAVLAGETDAVVTGPINKEALHLAGINFPGHTEIFAERTGSDKWCMMQYSEEVTATFVTCHVGLAEIAPLITEARVRETIDLTVAALKNLPTRPPKIVVCGLNPHAGENGLFGNREEESAIIPAIESARLAYPHMEFEGPLPPDTCFLPGKRKTTGAYICMYHDQGHIPLKALAFDSAVNTTLGLPVIRTSVDHGTAFDIAWQGKANPGSAIAAATLAVRLAKNRKKM